MDKNSIKEILNKDISFSIKLEDLALLMDQLSLMTSSGIPIDKAIEISKDLTNTSITKMLNSVNKKVSKGVDLSKAFAEEDFESKKLLSAMVESGEMSSSLDFSLAMLADYYRRKAKNKKELKSQMLYPIILLITCILVLILMMVFVMPSYMDLFSSRKIDLPGPTKFLIALSSLVRGHGFLILIGILFLVIGVRVIYRSNDKFKYEMDKFVLKLPIIGRYKLYNFLSYIAFTINVLLRCGVAIDKIMEVIREGVDNSYYKKSLENISAKIEKGEEIYKAFQAEGYFPQIFVAMIKVGEDSSSLEKIMDKTASYYRSRLKDSIKYMIRAFEPIMIIIMAFIVGFIVFSIAIPMLDLVTNF